MKQTKFHIAAGTEVKTCVRTSEQGVRWNFMYTELDVTYTAQDVVAKYDWGYVFRLPKIVHPFISLYCGNDSLTLELVE